MDAALTCDQKEAKGELKGAVDERECKHLHQLLRGERDLEHCGADLDILRSRLQGDSAAPVTTAANHSSRSPNTFIKTGLGNTPHNNTCGSKMSKQKCHCQVNNQPNSPKYLCSCLLGYSLLIRLATFAFNKL